MVKTEIFRDIVNKPKQLSREQKAALLSKKRYVRIVAGAGTGKTETLTRRIAYLLLYAKVDPSEIVAFTFTEKAAQSMKSRIYDRVRQIRGEDACARLGEMYVGTIHGFCLRLLQDHFGFGDHNVLNENQEMAFVLREGWGLGLGGGGRYANKCREFIRSVNVVYDELINRKKLKKKEPDFYKHLERYETLLNTHKLMTYGQMIYAAVNNIQSDPTPLRRIKHLIVDEYQDINKAQEYLIKAIGRHASVFIVGDPRQSIYQWRGSNEACFENFSKLFPGCETVVISENRRSVKQVVKIANIFAQTFEGIKYKDIKAIRKGNGHCFLLEAEDPEEEADWVVAQIEEYVNSGTCTYNDIGILLRSVTTSGPPFIDLLRERSIPYLVGGKVGLFRREEAQAVGQIFAWTDERGFWVENPYNWNDQIRGDDLLDSSLDNWQSVTGLSISRLRKKLEKWKQDILGGKFDNFSRAYQQLLVILGYLKLDPDNSLHAALVANLGRFNTLLTDYESSVRFGGTPINWPQALRGLCWYINTHATSAYDEQPSEDIRGINAVQIMTVHQAKGLEWPVVFVPCLARQRFPSSMTGSQQNWLLPKEMFDVERYEGTINDERRLFYVAITRARDLLCLSRFQRINNRTRESQFLTPLRDHLTELRTDQRLPIANLTKSSDEDEIQTFSAGEIIEYLKCPHFYRFREIWNYQPGLVTPLGYGKSLHFCLRHASDLIKNGMKPDKAIIKAVEGKFHLPYAGGVVRENMKNKAKKVLGKFVREHIEDMGKIEEVEARLEFPVQKATITGRVDVIIKDENEMEARDYKTSDEVTTPKESALQLTLYTMGLRKLGKPVTRASVATLEEARIRSVDVSEESIRNARKTAEKAIEKIKSGDFAPRPGRFCKNCDYTRICNCNSK